MAPLDEPMSGTPYLSSSEMIASVWGGTTRQKHRDHVLLLYGLVRAFRCKLQIEFVVERDQFYLLATDSAPGIDGIQAEFFAIRGFLHASAHCASKTRSLSDKNLHLAVWLNAAIKVTAQNQLVFFMEFLGGG